MSPVDDQADVEKVLAGEIAAFEGIVRRWQGPLVNLAYRFCRDRARAEEMAQEAFLRAYRGLNRWRKEAAFSTWLFAVATNLYRSELRRRRSAKPRSSRGHGEGKIVPREGDPGWQTSTPFGDTSYGGGMMKDADLDRRLSGEEDIIPHPALSPVLWMPCGAKLRLRHPYRSRGSGP